MEIITRKEALSQGLTRYYTGVPCKQGHDCEKYVREYRCCECHRLYKIKKYQEDETYRNRILSQQQDAYKKDPEKFRERGRKNNVKFKNQIREQKKKRYASDPRLRKHVLAKVKAWGIKNPEKVRLAKEKCKKHYMEDLTDPYICSLLTGHGSCLTAKDIPPNFIKAKREHLRLTRTLKDIQNGRI
jgi:hypothetical protein